MGNPSGQRPDGFQLLDLEPLGVHFIFPFLLFYLVGDITDDAADADDLAVFPFQGELNGVKNVFLSGDLEGFDFVDGFTTKGFIVDFLDNRSVPGVKDLFRRFSQQRLGLHSQLPGHGRIDKGITSVRVFNEYRIPSGRGDHFIALFTGCQRLF